uniref:Uncharacterized protein n=1 Tax=Arundo donax TaxID=35708 RepID=A0A0A9G581_ARUDO
MPTRSISQHCTKLQEKFTAQ